MIQLEQDYGGQDFNMNLKAINPSPLDLNGIYVGSYLQSITKNLALGFETIYQRQAPQQTDFTTQYVAKLTGTEKDWIATATVQPAGMMLATYWHKLSEKVDAAAELQIIAAPARRDAIATLGAKYDLRMSTFRAQVDSTGKVSALLEQRFAPTFTFTVAGEIDHFKVRFFFSSSVFFFCSADFVLDGLERSKGGRRCVDREHDADTGGDGNARPARVPMKKYLVDDDDDAACLTSYALSSLETFAMPMSLCIFWSDSVHTRTHLSLSLSSPYLSYLLSVLRPRIF